MTLHDFVESHEMILLFVDLLTRVELVYVLDIGNDFQFWRRDSRCEFSLKAFRDQMINGREASDGSVYL